MPCAAAWKGCAIGGRRFSTTRRLTAEQIERRVPDDFEDLTEEEQQRIVEQLEEEVLSVDPAVLRDEIQRLTKLIDQARALESRDVQTKLNKLRSLLVEQGIFEDRKMKLLLFTEHKDTLDYLAGDGRDDRPVGKLRDWGLSSRRFTAA